MLNPKHITFVVALISALAFYYFKSPTLSVSMDFKKSLPKIAVTGSNGSVGKRVVLAAIQRGYHVVAIDRSPLATVDGREFGEHFTFLQTDLTDFDATLKALAGCESIVHLAAFHNPGDYKVQTHNANVVISWNVLRAAAELGINRVAQASSVNAVNLVFSQTPTYEYFPIDEEHPAEPDEPYGLSKVIGELQAKTIVKRFPSMRIASIRLHWSIPNLQYAQQHDHGENAARDLWGWIQEDSGADAFLRAVSAPTDKWPSAAEVFFIAAPETTSARPSKELMAEYWPGVPVKAGKSMEGRASFFDSSKAERLLGWKHNATENA
ncbi:NAD-binding protein [Mycena kentingensis (nom. inval.)]|nr:NAD-binding protein [Mycena kentingensis (nom. inval.)]